MTHVQSLSLATIICSTGCDSGRIDACAPANDEGAYLVTDAMNYVFEGSLNIASQTVTAQIETCVDNTDNDGDDEIDELDECLDLEIEWSEVTHDLQGHEMDPVDDVDNVALVIFRYLSQAEVQEKLSQNALVQADVGLYVATDPGDETSVSISDLTLLGNEIGPHQYLEEDYGTFLLYLQKGNAVGVGVKMSQFIEPKSDSDQTSVSFSNTSTVLDYEVDLLSNEPLLISSDAEVSVDWSGLTQDGLGQEFSAASADQLMIARYSELTIEDLQSNFLDIELLADDIWTLDLGAETTADLSLASGDSGFFEGLDDSSTFILALRCTACANPAPLFMATLESCSAP